MKAGRRPYAVFKTDGWKWACEIPYCFSGNWSTSHQAALADGEAHLRTHKSFGLQVSTAQKRVLPSRELQLPLDGNLHLGVDTRGEPRTGPWTLNQCREERCA